MKTGNDRRVILSSSLAQELYGGDSAEPRRRDHSRRGSLPGGRRDACRVLLSRPECSDSGPHSPSPRDRNEEYHSNNWNMIGRLARGATIEQAQAQVDALNQSNLERVPQFRELLIEAGFHTRVVHLQSDLVRHVAGTLYLLWAGVVLRPAHGMRQRRQPLPGAGKRAFRELSLRVVLGAGRIRIARQLVTETVLLTSASAILGTRPRLGLRAGLFGPRTGKAAPWDRGRDRRVGRFRDSGCCADSRLRSSA